MANINIDATTPQLKTVKGAIDGYCSLDLKNALPFLAKDFAFQTFPKIPGLPDEPKGEHLERYAGIFALFSKVEPVAHEVIEAPGKVVIHISYTCTTNDGTILGYDSALVITLTEEDGEAKLLAVKDFSDPVKRGNLHAWVAKALARGGLSA